MGECANDSHVEGHVDQFFIKETSPLTQLMTYLPQLPKVLIQSFLYQTYFDRGKFANIFIIYREQSITADERTFRFDQNEYRLASRFVFNGPEFNFSTLRKSSIGQSLASWFSLPI